MQAFLTLVRRELGAQFLSWSGYVILFAVLFLLGMSFEALIVPLNNGPTDRPITEIFYGSWYFWIIILLAPPVITMRSFAQEKSSGTFETLMTTPISDLQVVLAKFSAALIFYTLMWLPLLGCLFIIRYYSHDPSVLETGVIVSSFSGIFLLGCLYMAMGCFASSLTKNQIIASMVSIALGGSLFVLSFLSLSYAQEGGLKAQLFNH
ncbi:MAG TPA: ABC transporter permease, partial [Verrucomicrobiae bacterium]